MTAAMENANMRGKICMVTGASSGIGKATALGLAKLGAAVVMICRDSGRGQAALEEIKAESGNASVELMLADLASQSAIRQLAADYERTHNTLHVLVNNAGIITPQRTLTVDGIEQNFAVNHLAYFMLTLLLLNMLKASTPARIINVTSPAESFGKINFADLMAEQKFNAMVVYAQSKLANVLFTYELARQLAGKGVTVNCLSPGAVQTNIFNDLGGFFGLMTRLTRPFASTPEQGAQPSLYLATSGEVEGVSGKYFDKQKPKQSSKASYDTTLAQRLWQVSAELTGLESAEPVSEPMPIHVSTG
jgi:retinol dehydrogenase 14